MTLTARRATYTAILEGRTTPVAVLRSATAPATISAAEHDARVTRERARFESARALSDAYAQQQIAQTVALMRLQKGGFRKP